MTIFLYDHTFEGLLTALFDAYFRKRFPDMLLTDGEPLPLFYDESYTVTTDTEKAERVWKGLQKKLSADGLSCFSQCWLSELPEAPMLMFRYMRKVFESPGFSETNFADTDVLTLFQLSKKVSGERYRVLQFMRFQKTAEGIYFGIMAPIYNVIPLTIEHFRDRFTDQRWLIYDSRRQYGYYYDGEMVNEITFTEPRQAHLITGILDDDLLAQDERLIQSMWKNYFKSICIKERINPRKHKKDLPVRYWKYLTEKL